MNIDHRFEIHGTHGIRYSDNICTEASYQRNGISGEGFTAIRFTHVPTPAEGGEPRDLIGVVFESLGYVAVIDPTDLETHWRGDQFEPGLREAQEIFMRAWTKEMSR